jgi:hypothetical protein
MSKPDRGAMLDRDHPRLSIRRQCVLLGLARSGVYRPSKAANDDDLAVMRRLDELFLAHPFLGSRRMAAMLQAEGRPINRKRVRRLMRLMGIAAIGPKPRTSKPAPGHKIYPYLLRDMVIDKANQVPRAPMRPLRCSRIGQRPMGGRHHLPPDVAWISVPGRDHRLGEPGSAGVAAVEQHGRLVLPRGAGRGARALWQARDL